MFLFDNFVHFACVENVDGFVGVQDGLLILFHPYVDWAQIFISGSNIIFNLTNILHLKYFGIISEDTLFDFQGVKKIIGGLFVISLKFVVHTHIITRISQTPLSIFDVHFVRMRQIFSLMSFHFLKHGFCLHEERVTFFHIALFHVCYSILVIFSDPVLQLLLSKYNFISRL